MKEIILGILGVGLVAYAAEVSIRLWKVEQPHALPTDPNLPRGSNGTLTATTLTIDGETYSLKPDGTLFKDTMIAGAYRLLSGERLLVVNSTGLAYEVGRDNHVRLRGEAQGDTLIPMTMAIQEFSVNRRSLS